MEYLNQALEQLTTRELGSIIFIGSIFFVLMQFANKCMSDLIRDLKQHLKDLES